MYKPGITLAMIVKNDADRLKRCLSSAQGAYDRLVIVDTGSTDGTIQVAKDFKAELTEIEWPGAFDAARNIAFSKVKTEWTFWLDSDEWLEAGHAHVLKASTKGSNFMFSFLRRHDLDENGSFSEIDLIRLWRTHPKLRMIGIVHERFPVDILTDINANRVVPNLPVIIWHDGYVGDQDAQKVERNVALLYREVELRPDDFYAAGKLAEALFAAGQIEDGRKRVIPLANAVARNESWTNISSIAAIVLSLAIRSTPDDELNDPQLVDWLRAVAQTQSRTPTPLWEYARVSFRRGDFEQARAALLRLDHFRKTGDYDRLSPTNPVIFGKALDDNLAEVERILNT